MNEQQIQALMARVDARVDSQIASKLGNMENITPVAFEEKYMKGYNVTWPVDQALFRKFLHAISTDEIVGKYFKTIGGAAATTKEDTLNLAGANGIAISVNGKTITINASSLNTTINKLIEFCNSSIMNQKVKSIFHKYKDTAVEGIYFSEFISSMNAQQRLDYWNAMIQTGYNPYGVRNCCTVPFSDTTICNVFTKLFPIQGQPFSHYAIVEIMGIGSFMEIEENYVSNNPPTVDYVNPVMNFATSNAFNARAVSLLDAKVINHESRIAALEGNQ